MKLSRWWIALLLLLAGTLALARLPHGRKVQLPRQLAAFPAEINGWQSFEIPLEDRIVAMAGTDSHLSRGYVDAKQDNVLGLYVGYFASQQAGDSLHSPKNCLPGGGWHPVSSSQIPLRLPDGRSYPANLYLVENDRERLLVLYWYQAHGRIVASEYWAKFYMVLDGIRLNRTDSAIVRVTARVAGSEPQARQMAVNFAEQVAARLDQFIPR